jgi:hypothetical protein
VENHWRRVFLDLGMKMDVENTENGCTMKISK